MRAHQRTPQQAACETTTRSAWTLVLVTVGAFALLAGCRAPDALGDPPTADGRPSAEAPAAQPELGFSDAHVHLNDVDLALSLMDEWGIDRVVAMPGRTMGHAGLLKAAGAHPGRFLPFLSISPELKDFRSAWAASDPSLVRLVDSLLASGAFRGIGEISVTHFPRPGYPEADFDPQGPIMRGILASARTHRVPVTVHVEVSRLPELEVLLRAFPDVPVIWAHGGYATPPVVRRMLEGHPQLHVDLSARLWMRRSPAPDRSAFRHEDEVLPAWLDLIEAMPERFLVGTNASLRNRSIEGARIRRVRTLLEQLSEPTRRLVAHDNLARILGEAR